MNARLVASRLAAVTLAALLLGVAAAAPASAHNRAEDASNWRSEVVRAPDLPGVDWLVLSGGLDVEVRSRADVTIVVLGYEGEPYLEISPSGVRVNRNSPATYLNSDRYADVALPRRADAAAEPEWRTVTDEPRYVWHDHRTHWMAPGPPAYVQRDRRSTHLVQTWELPVLVDGVPDVVTGELTWVPAPAPAAWFTAAVLLTLVGLAAATRLRPATALRVGAAALAAVSAANAVHLVDEFVARPLPTIDIVAGALHTGLFVVIGIGTAAWAWRARWGRRLVLAFGSATVLLYEGLLQTVVLRSSQITSVWPDDLVRLLAVASIAQAGVVAGVLLATRQTDRPGEAGTFGSPDTGRVPAGVG